MIKNDTLCTRQIIDSTKKLVWNVSNGINQSDQSIANSFLSRLSNSKCRIKVFSSSLFVKYWIPYYKSHKMYRIVPYINMKCRQIRPFGALGSPMFKYNDLLAHDATYWVNMKSLRPKHYFWNFDHLGPGCSP